jgi:hypothetical protein
MFSVRYELNYYILFGVTAVSHTCQTVRYGHESSGTQNEESLCWRGPEAI